MTRSTPPATPATMPADEHPPPSPAAGPDREAGLHEPWVITLGELDRKLGVEVLEQSAQRVVATMPVDGNRQSLGLLHGGASLALAEAVGSWAAVIHASTMGKSAVGLDVAATHHCSARAGVVTATAEAISLGRSITSHLVTVTDDAGRRLATVKITNYLLDRPVPARDVA